MLKCVPFVEGWTGGETRLDLKAVYARRKQDNWGNPILDAEGKEQWDTTGPLPMRRHNAWAKKGWKYITLADYDSLEAVKDALGPDWMSYIQDRRTRSPFNVTLWQQGLAKEQADELADLKILVEKFGEEAVTEIRQKDDPNWRMPAGVVPAKRGPGRPPKEQPAA